MLKQRFMNLQLLMVRALVNRTGCCVSVCYSYRRKGTQLRLKHSDRYNVGT